MMGIIQNFQELGNFLNKSLISQGSSYQRFVAFDI